MVFGFAGPVFDNGILSPRRSRPAASQTVQTVQTIQTHFFV